MVVSFLLLHLISCAFTVSAQEAANQDLRIRPFYPRAEVDDRVSRKDTSSVKAEDRQVQALIDSAQTALNEGQFQEVEKILQRALTLFPENARAQAAWARYLYSQRRFAEAEIASNPEPISKNVVGSGITGGGNASPPTPATFIFGFEGVGGEALPPPVIPEPTTFLLMGSGLAALAAWKRRKR